MSQLHRKFITSNRPGVLSAQRTHGARLTPQNYGAFIGTHRPPTASALDDEVHPVPSLPPRGAQDGVCEGAAARAGIVLPAVPLRATRSSARRRPLHPLPPPVLPLASLLSCPVVPDGALVRKATTAIPVSKFQFLKAGVSFQV